LRYLAFTRDIALAVVRPASLGLLLILLASKGVADEPVEADEPVIEADVGDDSEPPTLPETVVEADPIVESFDDFSDYPSLLESNFFRSPPVDGYRADSSTTGSIIDVADIELPATVNVAPRDLLDDQQALGIGDVLRDAGAAISAGDQFFADQLFLRGLQVRTRDFRKDGFLDPTITPRDFWNIERVEILKGPSSALYGSAAPSGTVNLVTKKPFEGTLRRFDFTFGSYGQNRYDLDLNGYVNPEGNVLYRLTVAYEDTNTFRDFGFIERTMIAPAVTWILGPDTTLTWQGEYHKDDRRGDRGVPIIGGDPLGLPPERYLGEPANDYLHTEDLRQSLVLNHRINDRWDLMVGGSSLFYEYPSSQTYAVAVAGAEPFYARIRQEGAESSEQAQSAIANLAGDACIGGLRNRLLVGAEYVYFDSSATFFQDFTYPPINAVAPTYTNPPPALGPPAELPVYRQQRLGVYFQDLVDINDHWQFLAGVRLDSVDMTYDRTFGGFLTNRTEQRFNRASPRVGLIYQPIPDVLTTYFNYSQSFNPPGGGPFITPPTLQPELGELYELGVKTQLLPELTLSAAGFYITRKNSPFITFPVVTQVGEERSQGVEVNLYGDVTQQLGLVANYAYTDTELTDPINPAFFGQPQRNVPLHSANLWARYDLIENECHTLGTAVGLVYLGSRSANVDASVALPAYGRWDAGVYYERGRLHASLYLENLFDVAYATGSIDEFQIFPGAPFNARARVGITY